MENWEKISVRYWECFAIIVPLLDAMWAWGEGYKSRLEEKVESVWKITARFKLSLKADGLNYKMIFKFGKYVERLLSASNADVYTSGNLSGQGSSICCRLKAALGLSLLRCAPQTRILLCKILVGSTQTLELHRVDADCAMALLKRPPRQLRWYATPRVDREKTKLWILWGYFHVKKGKKLFGRIEISSGRWLLEWKRFTSGNMQKI